MEQQQPLRESCFLDEDYEKKADCDIPTSTGSVLVRLQQQQQLRRARDRMTPRYHRHEERAFCEVPLSSVPKRKLRRCRMEYQDERRMYGQREYDLEKRLYTKAHLNAQQRVIFNYISDNPNTISLIQAGPGTGKTFTMLTLAHCWPKHVPVVAVIYKHDLLYTFRHCAMRITAASFFMDMFRIRFHTWCALETQLSGRMTAYEFTHCVIGLLRRAHMPSVGKALVIFDEYTVIPKPLLYVTLLLFKQHSVSTVICGDRNQLQNIMNSSHATCSSYDIAHHFADKIFELDKNERCDNASYNKLVDYISRYSSSARVDQFGYALIASIFYRNCVQSTNIRDIHLAATHHELTDLHMKLVMNEKCPVSFYYINGNNVRNKECINGMLQENGLYVPMCIRDYLQQKPCQFLPYIPLVLNGKYFVRSYSEYSQGTLVAINYFKSGQCATVSVDEQVPVVAYEGDEDVRTLTEEYIVSVVVRMEKLEDDSGENVVEYETLTRCDSDSVMFERHKEFLLGHRGRGSIYNFPIYPTTTMSIHMAQGRTIPIEARLDLNLYETTYQGLYVAISRVRSPKQISRVVIPHMISHLISVIINFPEYCYLTNAHNGGGSDDGDAGKIDDLSLLLPHPSLLHERFSNYMYYEVPSELTSELAYYVINFINSEQPKERQTIREQILTAVNACNMPRQLLRGPEINNNNNVDGTNSVASATTTTVAVDNDNDGRNEVTMNLLLSYHQLVLALATILETDAFVWLHEFFKYNREFKHIQQCTLSRGSIMEDEGRLPTLKDLTGLLNLCKPNKLINEFIYEHAYRIEKRENKHQYYLEEYPVNNLILKTSAFQYQVYRIYEKEALQQKRFIEFNGETINGEGTNKNDDTVDDANISRVTLPWLMQQLHSMVNESLKKRQRRAARSLARRKARARAKRIRGTLSRRACTGEVEEICTSSSATDFSTSGSSNDDDDDDNGGGTSSKHTNGRKKTKKTNKHTARKSYIDEDSSQQKRQKRAAAAVDDDSAVAEPHFKTLPLMTNKFFIKRTHPSDR